MTKGEICCVGRNIAVMCLQRWFLRGFLPEHLVISHDEEKGGGHPSADSDNNGEKDDEGVACRGGQRRRNENRGRT